MRQASEPWGNAIDGDVHGNVVQARDIYVYGTRPRTVSAKRFVAEDFAGRQTEVAEIAAFCHGETAYSWWVGEPWSGKTALAAQIATRPPEGVDVVSFFVSRADGVHRISDYVAALTAELGGWTQDLDELWERAALRSAERGRSLLLIVDGLDENAGGDEPSIASQLPIDCPHGSHVLVTSRPHPELPDDVRERHPLRSCPRRTLHPNSSAIASRRAANLDLDLHLREPAARRVLGLLAVALGPLSADDVGTITGDFYTAETLLTQSMARLLKPGYTLAHETLLTVIVAKLGVRYLDERRAELHAWADRYADWPDDTPSYLIERYPQLLVETQDARRLAALCNGRRFRLLRALTGADFLTMRELSTARALQREAGEAARLEVWIDVLGGANWVAPQGFSALLARHGRIAEAEYVAHELVGPEQALALNDIAEIIGADDERQRALLVEIEELQRDMVVDALLDLALALASTDVLERAVQDAQQIVEEPERTSALVRCAWTASMIGTIADVDRIGVAAGGADKVTVATAMALVRAGRLAEGAELFLQHGVDPAQSFASDRAELVRVLVYEFARLGDTDAIDRLLAALGQDRDFDIMLAFAQGVAEIADPDDFRDVLRIVAALARDTGTRGFDHLGDVAALAVARDELELAVELANELNVVDCSYALVQMVYAVADGPFDVAMALAESITDRSDQIAALLAVALATPDQERSAELLARIDRLLADSMDLATVAISLAFLAAGHDHRDDAIRLALHAERLAETEQDEGARRYVMARVIRVLTGAHARFEPAHDAWVAEAAEWLLDQQPGDTVDYTILEVLTAVLPLLDADQARRMLLHLGGGALPEMTREIVRVAREAGRGELAGDLELPDPPSLGIWITIDHAKALAEAGEHAEAEALLRNTEQEFDAEDEPAASVEIACLLGEHQRAAELAASAIWPLRLELLTVVARSMLAAGKPLEAESIVVGPPAEDDTRIPDLVADIDPSAVPLLADTFTEIVDYLGHR